MRYLTILAFILLGSNLVAQSSDFDTRLTAVYERAHLERLANDHPVMLQRLVFSLDNGWYLTEYSTEKGEVTYPVLEVEDPEAINFVRLEYEQGPLRDYKTRKKYRLKDSDLILVCLSGEEFTEAFNAQREKR